MELRKIRIESKSIILKVVQNGDDDGAVTQNDQLDSKITAKEEPNPSFTAAFAALGKAFVSILELPDGYVDGLNVVGITISRTKQGTRSASLSATKQLECRTSFLHTLETPFVQLEKSADGESGSVLIDGDMAKLILTAIHESEKYLAGDRSQALISFDEAKAGLNALAEKGRKDENQSELAV